MPSRVCRIKYQAGQPLSLSITPAVTFLGLPPEVRNIVYRFCLTSDEPVVVTQCHGKDEEDASDVESNDEEPDWVSSGSESGHDSDQYVWSDSDDSSDMPAQPWRKRLRGLGLGLLLCNKQISQEAAKVFYETNDFHLTSCTSDWSRLYLFLKMIGPVNRDRVRRVSLPVRRPNKLWRDPDGVLMTSKEWHTARVVTSPHPQSQLSKKPAGWEDALDPAITPCLHLLGNARPTLTLTLAVELYCFPSVWDADEQRGEQIGYVWPMDLPKVIERRRRKYNIDQHGQTCVDVRWKGTMDPECFGIYEKTLEKHWDIVETKTAVLGPYDTDVQFVAHVKAPRSSAAT